jgi:hypothetical protein
LCHHTFLCSTLHLGLIVYLYAVITFFIELNNLLTIVCRQLARPQLGLKLRTLAFLDIPLIDLMSRKFGISSGLIVGEVHLTD